MNINLVDLPSVQEKPKRVESLLRFYDAKNTLLYVSKVPNPTQLKNSEWWSLVSFIKVEHFDSLDAIADAKAAAIANENPLWGGKPGRPLGS